jgi:hypothetical protein
MKLIRAFGLAIGGVLAVYLVGGRLTALAN